MIVNDPSGFPMGVTSENRGKVSSVSESLDRHVNHHNGKIWSVSFFDVNPAGANDYFFYLSNTGAADLSLTGIQASCTTTTGRLYLKVVSGSPIYVGSSDVVPVTRNLGKSVTLSAVAKTDTDITGLSDDGILGYMELSAVNTAFMLGGDSDVVIPQGKSIALQWVAATGEVSASLSFMELPEIDNL